MDLHLTRWSQIPTYWFHYCARDLRKKLDSEFNDEDNKLEMADTQAAIILRAGRTLQQPEGRSDEEYDAFVPFGNESIP
ncbi:hypothetical protein Tco_1386699 [Tanacetum coccineum]